MFGRRTVIASSLAFVFIFTLFNHSGFVPGTSVAKDSASYITPPKATTPKESLDIPASGITLKDDLTSALSPQVLNYFEQAFSVKKPALYDFPALRAQCERTHWPEDDVYLHCTGMLAGLTSIMSQVKVCLKMAIETGTGLILPSMPIRDSNNLAEFNFLNEDAYLGYGEWFDAQHLIESFGQACPQMKILRTDQLAEGEVSGESAGELAGVVVKNRWQIAVGLTPGYQPFTGWYWVGRSFKNFFEKEYSELEKLSLAAPDRNASSKGITIVKINCPFLLFRVTDDPTGQETRLWNDLSHLIRFNETPRKIIGKLTDNIRMMDRPFYGVHFRVEKDTIWSSLDHQLAVDLDALDLAWKKYGKAGAQKPLVYLACGDQEQVAKFVEAGTARGWDVTHKWGLVSQSGENGDPDTETLKAIDELPFDFQGAVDMGIMVKSDFFLGITGSAFSSTIANARDVTGRYRGSSFEVFDDENARTHLFNDGDAAAYACCL